MRRRIAVYGASDEALALLPALARRRDLELAWVYDPDAPALRRRLAWIAPGAARLLQAALTDDPSVAARAGEVELVIDGGLAAPAPPAGAVTPAAASARLRLPPTAWRDPRPPATVSSAPAADALPEALERAIAAGRRFALLRCDAHPGAGPRQAAPDGVDRVRRRAAESLRGALAPGEQLEAAPDGALLALLALDDGVDASARLVGVARAAAEHVAKELGGAPQRTPLVFGYALHPDDGCRAEDLLARAARPRIRML